MYTLTEDYALGMELKKRKWQCRYVNEYLAVGEAPEQVRNCFQQRSRWAKGCAARQGSRVGVWGANSVAVSSAQLGKGVSAYHSLNNT